MKIPALLLNICVTLDTFLNFSEPLVSSSVNGAQRIIMKQASRLLHRGKTHCKVMFKDYLGNGV